MNIRPPQPQTAALLYTLIWGLNIGHASPAQPSLAQGLIAPKVHASSDSDNMRITKTAGGVLYRYNHPQHYTGLVWEHQQFRQTGQGSLSGQVLSWVTQHIDPATALGYQLQIGHSQGPGRSLLTFDGSTAYAPHPTTRLEWFATRDRVDAMSALARGLHYTLAGGAIDYTLHPRLTAVSSVTHTQFSDSTDRQQLRFRFIWDALPEHGITLQTLHRQQWGDSRSQGFFNPERLQEHMAAVGWRQRFDGWLVTGRISAGRQQVNQGRWQPARLSEIQLTSPPSPNGQFKLRLGEQKNIELSGPNYRYRSLDIQWLMPL